MKIKLKNIIVLLRPIHYLKNLFIFLPMFFALKITDVDLILNTLFAFIAFSLVASAVYVINDLFDLEEDKKHPIKKLRPIASEKISKSECYFIVAVLLSLSLIISALLVPGIIPLLAFYLLLNIGYSIKLKHLAIIDIFILAIGFVIRLFVGSVASGVDLSKWIIIMTFLLSLFLALGKRRDDVIIHIETGQKTRKLIDGYNLDLLNISMAIMSSVTIVSYILYTVSYDVIAKLHSDKLYITVVYVIFGILRYLQIALVEKDSSSPIEILIKDRLLQASILGWIITFGILIY